MRAWGLIFSVILFVGCVFYFLSLDEEKFATYQSQGSYGTTRVPAADPSEGSSEDYVIKVSPLKKSENNENSESIYGQAEIKPLDSRSIAAESVVQAQNWQRKNATPIQIQGIDYTFAKDTYAVLKRDWDENDPQIIGELLGHYLIQSESPIVDANPVLIENQTSNFAIVTKVLKVKLSNLDYRDELFTESYRVVEEFSHINVVLYKFNDLESLKSSYERSLNHPEVVRSNIEILKGARTEQ